MNIEKKQFYKDLVELGKSKGSLSNREIMDAIDEVALDAEPHGKAVRHAGGAGHRDYRGRH